ncbi:MAG: molybdopterin biosynthesis protein [archaeon]
MKVKKMMKVKEFHDVLPIDEARRRFYERIDCGALRSVTVDLDCAPGRVLSCDVSAGIDVPGFSRSNRDGYAVVARDTYGADEERAVALEVSSSVISAGADAGLEVALGQAARIATGAPMPRGANAVVMSEYCNEADGKVDVSRAVYPGENVMHAGQDIMQGEVVLRRGTRIGFRETAVLAAIGAKAVDVYKRPRVAVISTGNEIVEAGGKLPFGKIYDVNSRMIADACREIGADADVLGIAKDDEAKVMKLLRKGLMYDAVIISGGTSAGQGDVSYRVIDKLEPGIIVHGVAMKPGKPVVLAASGKKPIFVLPGFPMSCIVTFNVFARPVLLGMAGAGDATLNRIRAKLALKYVSDGGKHEFVLSNVVLSGDGGYYAYPIMKGSGAVSGFSLADGYFEVGAGVEYADCGDEVEVVLLSLKTGVSDLVFIGSQCMGADAAIGMFPGTVKVINAGSMGGLLACRRGEADVAGMHLMRDGVYNVPFMEKGLVLVRGYRRKQGIMYCSLRHKSIDEFLDDDELLFINRNGGSGTRILTDMLIDEYARKRGVDADAVRGRIRGFDNEAKSHNAVACAVAAGKADWGIGILSSAKMYGLKFVELRDEEYDFCVPMSKFSKKGVQEFISVLKSDAFKKRIEKMEGFVATEDMGEVVYRG